jgi:hypothetical protein
MSVYVAFRLFLGLAIIAAMIWGSILLDRRWRGKNPTELSFRWGYFQALCFFPGGLMAFVAAFRFSPQSPFDWLYLISFTVIYGVIGSLAGYTLITKKRKWAWLFVVFAQLNLITWLIDASYGKNRWKEFR